MRATRDGARWSLDGVKDYVLDGHGANVILVAAHADDGLALFRHRRRGQASSANSCQRSISLANSRD